MMSADVNFERQHLTHLTPVNQGELRVVIMKFPSKSYELDPLPANLVKKVLICLVPLMDNNHKQITV